MTFDEWHQEYAKRYEERGLDDVPPIVDMQAAWNAAIEACAGIANAQIESLNLARQSQGGLRGGAGNAYESACRQVTSKVRALSTAKAEGQVSDRGINMNCSKCNRSIQTKDGTEYAGLSITIQMTTGKARTDFDEMHPELVGTLPIEIRLCYVCWLAGMGITVDMLHTKAEAAKTE